MDDLSSFGSILTRWRNGDKSAIAEFFEHPEIVRRIKSLVKRYGRKPIKTGNTYCASLGFVDGDDVVQTIRLVFLETVARHLDLEPKEVLDYIDTNIYYEIHDEILKQHGYTRDTINWMRPETVSTEIISELENNVQDELDCNNEYGFSDDMWEAIEQLRPIEKEAVCLYFGDGLSLKQVSDEMGISVWRVCDILFGRRSDMIGAVEKIKEMLN
jgi:RNA polymerase sigma factor (sigma-70 family)